MLTSPARVDDTGAKRLAAKLYAYSFLDEFVLLYPVYALLFADTGLSTAEISSLFVIWSLTGFLLEVPSGVWADVVSRRLLLAIGPLLTAIGYSLWVAVPSYWAFAAGFVLWGAKGALQSGAFEALTYEELDRLGAADRYARTVGRATSAGLIGVMVALAAAGPVFAAGGYLAVGAASVVGCVLTGAVAATLPEHRSRHRPDDETELPGGYAATLRAGLSEARRSRPVRSALLLVAAVTAIWGALEEYDVLLIRDAGVPVAAVPVLALLIWSGVTAGGLLAGQGARLRTPAFAATLALGAVALAAGAGSGVPAGIALVAVAFGVFQMASVVADARLQEWITGPSRATVTSLAGLGTEVVTIAVYASYALASTVAAHRLVFAFFAVPYLLIAVVLGLGHRRLRRQVRPGVGPVQ
jgi:MFS family permease